MGGVILVLKGHIYYCPLKHKIYYFTKGECFTITLSEEQEVVISTNRTVGIELDTGTHKDFFGEYLYLMDDKLILTTTEMK